MKGIFGFLLFIFFLVVFFVVLTAGYVIKKIRALREAAQRAAEEQEMRYRNETGRRRQQYTQRQQARQNARQQQTYQGQQNHQGQQARQSQEEPYNSARQDTHRTQTATGETIIDHRRQERESKKIFDDNEGEYVEFEEA